VIETIDCIVDGKPETRRISHWEQRGSFVGGIGSVPRWARVQYVPFLRRGETVEYDLSGKPHIFTVGEEE